MSSKTGPRGCNRLRYHSECVYCGGEFMATRPDARTCSNQCRSRLRRWVARYGAAPIAPPGRVDVFSFAARQIAKLQAKGRK